MPPVHDWRSRILRGYFRAAGTVAPGLAARHAFDLCFRPHIRPPVSAAARRILDQADAFTLETRDHALQAYRWAGTGGGVVLLAHGWNSRASRLTEWVEPLRKAGFDVVAFDVPAHGDSPGRRTNGLEMGRAIADVATQLGPLYALVGHSAGAFASAVAAAGGHLARRGPVAVERLVMIAPVDDPGIYVATLASMLGWSPALYERVGARILERFGHPMHDYALTRIPGGWSQPTLLLHDPADPEVPYAQSVAVAAARSNATLVPFPGLGHHRIARDPRVIARAIEFLAPWTTAPTGHVN